jgi:hypothetical protein
MFVIGIVITSLGSDSSRSPSPDLGELSPETRRRLSQPGAQGFTLSPSLLTHLLNVRPDQLPHPSKQIENSLVLYRPLGIPPGRQADTVVKQWNGNPAVLSYGDNRFEEIDNDENTESTWSASERINEAHQGALPENNPWSGIEGQTGGMDSDMDMAMDMD